MQIVNLRSHDFPLMRFEISKTTNITRIYRQIIPAYRASLLNSSLIGFNFRHFNFKHRSIVGMCMASLMGKK